MPFVEPSSPGNVLTSARHVNPLPTSNRTRLQQKLDRIAKRAPRIAALFLAMCTIIGSVGVVMWPWLRDTSTLGFHDWDAQAAHRYLVAQALREHFEMPFWNPYACGGFQGWGFVESGTILVSPWLPAYLFLPMALAIRVEVLGMALIGAFGAYVAASRFTMSHAARAFVVAVWAVNGRWALQTAVGHTWHLAYAFLPWALYFFERARQPASRVRDVVFLGACFAALVYSGGVYPLPHTMLALSLYALTLAFVEKTPRPLVMLGLGGLCGIGLASPKLLPMIELFRRVPRLVTSNETLEMGTFFSLLTSHDQNYFSRPAHVSQYGWHEWGMYISLPAVVLLGLGLLLVQGKREAALKVASVMLGLLGFGAFHPLAPWNLLHAFVPLFKSQHVPSRFLYPALLLLALVIATGMGRLIEKISRTSAWIDPLVALLVLFLAYDVAKIAQLPMKQSMWMVPPDNLQPGEFSFSQEATIHYQKRDWAQPLYLAMLANRGVIQCYGAPPFERLGALALTNPKYRGEVFVADGRGQVTITHRTFNTATLHVDNASDGALVVFNMNFDEGWSASAGTVVNQDNRVAVRIPAGTRDIVLRFRPRSFVPGLLVGLWTLLVCASAVRREADEEAGKVTG